MASKQDISRVIESTDIVALVSEYVNLEKNGKNYKGLCPFHHEDTPSFIVNQEKKIAHCFGCGGGGNPISFLMQIENIDFNTALQKLAKRNGITLSEEVQTKESNTLTKYYKIMQIAKSFYIKNLENTDYGLKALQYLHKRGLDDETIKVFDIGLAPNQMDSLYQVLKESNFLELDCYDVGLIDKNDKGYYDFFIKRIMFPIHDENSNVIGFSARYFEQDKNQPKYINSKEGILFRKGEVLFNLNLAKGEILKKKRVILHEGQMDVIASYRSGLKESICTMGTAISLRQALLLKKYTTNVVICYDGDKAGINASLKAIKIFKQAGFNIQLVLLPDGMDPDEYVLKYGTDAYYNYFENNKCDALKYTFKQAILNKDLSDALVVDNIKNQIFELLNQENSSTKEEEYLAELSKVLGNSVEAIKNDYQKYCNLYPTKNYVDNYEWLEKKEEDLSPKSTIEFNNYEIRLFMYAKSSREKAMYIDHFLNDRFEAISKKNMDIWMCLINVYYERYQEFNEEKFVQLLDEDSKLYYRSIIEYLHNDSTPYTDEDLNACLKKLDEKKYDRKNEKIDLSIKKSSNAEEIFDLILKKFKNKKIKEDLKKMRRK